MARPLLQMSAQEGARLVALRYLDQASEAAERLHGSENDDALHDFRVGMRRLRSCIRAYRPVLGDAVGKKGRRRLKRIAARTNPGRDAEVQLEWIRKESDPERPEQRPGVEWLAEQLERERDAAYEHVREELYDRFCKVEAKLRERLSRYTVVRVVGEPEPSGRFGDVAAVATIELLELLVGELREVKGVEDEAIAHQARIHGKRLRYLLEPFRGELEDAKAVVKKLKVLQDLLGDLNDLHNLATTVGEALEEAAVARARHLREAATEGDGSEDVERALEADERPGLLAMLRQIHADRTAMLDALLNDWLPEGGELDALRDDVEALVARMRIDEGWRDTASDREDTDGADSDGADSDGADSDGADSDGHTDGAGTERAGADHGDGAGTERAATDHGDGAGTERAGTGHPSTVQPGTERADAEGGPSRPVEIERKYLLNGLPRACLGRDGIDIDQGYLPGERLVERVRRKRTPEGAKYVRTVKHGRGVERIELEEECSAEVFSTLWSLTEGRRVRKRRFVIEAENGLAWEIDQFADRELHLAEIELPTADTEVTFPEWLAPYVEREVTDDPAYVNLNLAR